jgi:hypothetical protein
VTSNGSTDPRCRCHLPTCRNGRKLDHSKVYLAPLLCPVSAVSEIKLLSRQQNTLRSNFQAILKRDPSMRYFRYGATGSWLPVPLCTSAKYPSIPSDPKLPTDRCLRAHPGRRHFTDGAQARCSLCPFEKAILTPTLRHDYNSLS